jgi:hypothetical protein
MLRQQVRAKSEDTSQNLNIQAINHWLSEDFR